MISDLVSANLKFCMFRIFVLQQQNTDFHLRLGKQKVFCLAEATGACASQ